MPNLTKRILAVEDQEDNRTILRDVLSRTGFAATVVNDR